MSVQYLKDKLKVILNSGETSDPIIVRSQVSIFTVTVSFPDGSGSAIIQTTNETEDDILNGTDMDLGTALVWVDWDSGEVTGTTQDVVIAKPSAIRLVNTGITRVKLTITPTF